MSDSPPPSASGTPIKEAVVLGAIAEINGTKGTVRFIGTTQFATGKWVGIELETANGKNDGSVQGKRYFTCKENYGVFVRASQVKIISQPDRRQTMPARTNSRESLIRKPAITGRESMIVRRPSGDKPPLPTVAELKKPIPEKVSTAPVPEPVESLPTIAEPPLPSPSSLTPTASVVRRESVIRRDEKPSAIPQTPANKEIINLNNQRIAELGKELQELRKQLSKEKEEAQSLRDKIDELQDSLELVTLDKEVAEERVEILMNDLETVKSQQQVLPEDINERELLSQNEKLKEALLKLRDSLQAVEVEKQKFEIENTHLLEYKRESRELKEGLRNHELTIQLLKDQLDEQNSQSQMIEILTEKNLELSDEVAELKEINRDLEMMKILNEELEEGHLEEERQLRDEQEQLLVQVREQERIIQSLQTKNSDLEKAIMKYKEFKETMKSKEEESIETQEIPRDVTELNVKLRTLEFTRQQLDMQLQLKHIELESLSRKNEICTVFCDQNLLDKYGKLVNFYIFLRENLRKLEIIWSLFKNKDLLLIVKWLLEWKYFLEYNFKDDQAVRIPREDELKSIGKKLLNLLERVSHGDISEQHEKLKQETDKLLWLLNEIKFSDTSKKFVVRKHLFQVSRAQEIDQLSVEWLTEGDLVEWDKESDEVHPVEKELTLPWLQVKSVNLDFASTITQLETELNAKKEDMFLLQKEVRTKNELNQQAQIKIELLENKIEVLRKESSVAENYAKMMDKWKEQELTYIEAIEKLQLELDDALEQTNKKDNGVFKSAIPEGSLKVSDTIAANLDLLVKKLSSRTCYENRMWNEFYEELSAPLPQDLPHAHSVEKLEIKSLVRDFYKLAASTPVYEIQPKDAKWRPIAKYSEHRLMNASAVLNTLNYRYMKLMGKMATKPEKQRPKSSLVGRVCIPSVSNYTSKLYLSTESLRSIHQIMI